MNDDGPDRRNLYWQRQAGDALLEFVGSRIEIDGEFVPITMQTVAAFRVMAQHVDRHGVCRLGHDEIARRTPIGGGKDPSSPAGRRMARLNLRRRHLRPLLALGAIERLAPGGGGRGRVGLWVIHNLGEMGVRVTPLSVQNGSHGDSHPQRNGSRGDSRNGSRGDSREEERNLRRGLQPVPIVENVDDGAWAPMPAGLREWRDGALVKGEASRIVARAAPRSPRPVQPELEPTTPATAKKAKIPPGSLYAAKLAAAREAFEAAEKIKP